MQNDCDALLSDVHIGSPLSLLAFAAHILHTSYSDKEDCIVRRDEGLLKTSEKKLMKYKETIN